MVLAFLIYYSVLHAQIVYTHNFDSFKLKGNVKSIKVIEHYAVRISERYEIGDRKTGHNTSLKLTYNHQGKATLKEVYDNNDSIPYLTITYKYDQFNNLIDLRICAKNGQEHRKGIYQYTYNEKGRYIEKLDIREEGKYVFRNTYTYDFKGNIRTEKSFDDFNCLRTIEKHFYNKNKQCTKTIAYSYDDLNSKKAVKNHITSFRFNEKGQLVEEKQYSPKGVVRYAESMNITVEGILISSVCNEYHEDLKTLAHSTTKIFDINSNVTEEIHRDIDKNETYTWTYHYVYDTNGNWIQRLRLMNDRPWEIIVRTIDYHS
jgi:hypothetical protein